MANNTNFQLNKHKYKVLTPSGFKNFAGISLMNISPTIKVTTSKGLFLECTADHKIYVNANEYKMLRELAIGDEIFTINGFDPIISIVSTSNVEPVYDLIEVDDGHKYYTNGVLSSNCRFITFEETLINSAKLAKLESSTPIHKTGQVRWFHPIDPTAIYIVGLDPSMGTGGDNSAIQVLELPSLRQVAEWCTNRAPIEEQIRTLNRILHEIRDQGNPEIYWSVESNTLGEAALVVIRSTGEEHFPGTMLHDPTNRLQGRTGRRAGFITTHKSKLECCAKLKFLIESEKLKINSKGLISELKVFVAKGNTFEARTGQTDDLVMSLILVIRMLEFVSTWDDKSQAAISIYVADEFDDDMDSPMPIFI